MSQPVPVPRAKGKADLLEFVCEQGARPGEVFPLSALRALIGRQDQAAGLTPEIDLAEQDAGPEPCTVSRFHAEISRAPEGCFVVDLGSSNGTTLNGEKMAPGDRRRIAEGDLLTLGKVALRLRAG